MKRNLAWLMIGLSALLLVAVPAGAEADMLAVAHRFDGQVVHETTARVTYTVTIQNLSEETLRTVRMKLLPTVLMLISDVVLPLETLAPDGIETVTLSFDIVSGLDDEHLGAMLTEWLVTAEGTTSGAMDFPASGRPVAELPEL